VFNASLQHGILIAIQPSLVIRALHRSPMGGAVQDDNYSNGLTLSINKNHVFSYRRNIEINESNLYINNVNINYSASAPGFDSKDLGFVIGRLLPLNTRRWFEGNISEIIIYDRYLTANEFNDINSYLFNKFNIKN
jgi:hypothetical protein